MIHKSNGECFHLFRKREDMFWTGDQFLYLKLRAKEWPFSKLCATICLFTNRLHNTSLQHKHSQFSSGCSHLFKCPPFPKSSFQNSKLGFWKSSNTTWSKAYPALECAQDQPITNRDDRNTSSLPPNRILLRRPTRLPLQIRLPVPETQTKVQ